VVVWWLRPRLHVIVVTEPIPARFTHARDFRRLKLDHRLRLRLFAMAFATNVLHDNPSPSHASIQPSRSILIIWDD
jgi:hypothetical protein